MLSSLAIREFVDGSNAPIEVVPAEAARQKTFSPSLPRPQGGTHRLRRIRRFRSLGSTTTRSSPIPMIPAARRML
jgi:hypothetical protein